MNYILETTYKIIIKECNIIYKFLLLILFEKIKLNILIKQK